MLDAADRHQVWVALAAGARALVLRDGPASDLVDAVRTAHRGHGWITADLHDQLVHLLVTTPPVTLLAELHDLTTREREVLELLVHGRSTADMAAELRLSTKTVKLHISNILRKLGVCSRAAAVALVTGNWSRSEGPGSNLVQ